jgi:tRNA A37 threonylcarbamoyladenosine dehydratase
MTGSREMFARNIMLYGEDGFARLQASRVAVVGLGGVGGYAAETLVRAGLGAIRIIDCDIVKPTDVNRQIGALAVNLNEPKTRAMESRLLSINPALSVDARHAFFHRDTAADLIATDLDFVVDAIDSLNPKGELIRWCKECGIPLVSAMGAACRTDPFLVRIGPLDGTHNCPLARALRRHLRGKGVSTDVTVVYSTEQPSESPLAEPTLETDGTYLRGRARRSLPSLPTIPAIFGILAAHHVISSLLAGQRGNGAG